MVNIDLEILNKFKKFIVDDSSKARAIIKQIDYKKNAYWLRCIALTYKDEAMFKNQFEMRKTFVKSKLDLAKKYIDLAFDINPICRDVLSTKGEIYNAIGDTFTAIDCYIKILDLGESLSAENNCSSSDLPFVQMLLNDARFQLYRLFYDLEDFEMSNKFLSAYKNHLKKGIKTIYLPLDKFLMS